MNFIYNFLHILPNFRHHLLYNFSFFLPFRSLYYHFYAPLLIISASQSQIKLYAFSHPLEILFSSLMLIIFLIFLNLLI